MHIRIPKHIIALTLLIAVVAPMHAIGTDPAPKPYQQKFVLTAYYSPLPDQCCYVLGGEKADKVMNGEGIAGADGTPVYPGMVAAPASYAFGTRITLPGIGVVTVHDRGGAIIEMEDGAHRIDVWAGFGEEGLARALAFGVQEVTGTVYPAGGWQPNERINLAELPAPPDRLKTYQVAGGLLDVHPKKGDKGLSVSLLQQTLTDVGFSVDDTAFYGDETEAALRSFLDSVGQGGEPADQLTTTAASHLLAAKYTTRDPDISHIDSSSAPADVQSAQRLLRFLGFYKGRTDGVYDGVTEQSILAFQQQAGLVGGPDSPGAGRIGPLTKGKLSDAWYKRTVARRAQRYMLLATVGNKLDARDELPDRFLAEGMTGDEVEQLQEALADLGYFPHDSINGVFGPLTKSSVLKFQLDRKVIASSADSAAGYVGPGTLRQIRSDSMRRLYSRVREQGVGVL